MKHPYLLDLNDSDSWLYPIEIFGPDGHKGEDQRTINMPEGVHKQFCVTDSVMYPGKVLGGDLHFHEHRVGYEIFFVDSGGLDLYMFGKKTYVAPGNILHIQPYQAHGMDFHAPTKYRGFFHDLGNSDNAAVYAVLREKLPEVPKDQALAMKLMGMSDFFPRELPDAVEIPVEQMISVRNINRPMAEFELEGASVKMLTARWENGGINELWGAQLKKGFHAEFYDYAPTTELYYVTDGEIEFNVYGETFVAHKECVIKIPKLATRSIKALTDATIYDIGGLTQWYAFFQDRASILKNDPARAAKPETWEELKTKYDCRIKSIGID
jgi:quercetin dioxygenase-like cupin family protein